MTSSTHRRRRVLAGAVAVAAAAAGVVALASPGSASNDPLTDLRKATARYHSVEQATKDGFGELKDKDGIACIDKAGAGGMGIHYVLGSRVGDPTENADAPEVVIYAPDKHGTLKLVAVEYVVLASDWFGAGHDAPPVLFGHSFTLIRQPNRYGLPPFFELHAWAWQDNASGTFADYNPAVVCPTA